MKRLSLFIGLALVSVSLFAGSAGARRWPTDLKAEMKDGKPEFKSMGPLAFGPDGILFAVPVLVRAKTDGQLEVVSLDKVKFSRADLPDPPADAVVGQGNRQSNPRRESITDIAFLDGRVIVAGLANEEFASSLRAIPFPFKGVTNGTSVEIYHRARSRRRQERVDLRDRRRLDRRRSA